MKKKITLQDISNALRIINEKLPPNKVKEFWWGWLETDYSGRIISIKLKRNQIKEIKNIIKQTTRIKIPNQRLETIFGIKVLNKIMIRQ